MDLPVLPPIEPMLATLVPDIPVAEGMSYEPKWDGFRCVIFRDGDEVELASRGGKTLTRYFPEVVAMVREQFPPRAVVDTEIVVILRPEGEVPRLDFDTLAQRIHPAASRVKLLARTTPASVVAFDLLALGDESLMSLGYAQRRARLVEALRDVRPPVYLTPVTADVATARDWFARFEGAGLDGVVAKPADLRYVPGKRLMRKIKHARTADVVVAGFRWHKSGPVVGSLLLGLHDDRGVLHHVGVCAAFSARRRKELLDELAPYRQNAAAGHPWIRDGATPAGTATDGAAGVDMGRAGAAGTATGGSDAGGPQEQRIPGEPSRWTGTKDLSWQPLRPELVLEVAYDAMEGDRFRHTAQFVRWRPDRTPESCGYRQLQRPLRFDVDAVLSGS